MGKDTTAAGFAEPVSPKGIMQKVKQAFAQPSCCEVTQANCNQGRNCPVAAGTHKPAQAVHQIAEPQYNATPRAGCTVELAAARAGTVYVSGPMTGIADYNYPAFNAAAAALRAQGYKVFNPADHGVVEGAEWADYLRADLAQLAQCETIHLLPGWWHSKGAQLELYVAQQLGMKITREPDAEPVAAFEFVWPSGTTHTHAAAHNHEKGPEA
jgi:hypothetical protein